MREIFIDVLQGSNNTITVTENDNLTETYKLILMKNRIRINLTDKKVKFVFVKSNSNRGDIFNEMNISNAIEGEVELPITNQISKENGMYSCGLAIYNNEGYLEHTGTFNLYVRENLFEKVSGELLENSAYKELMSLLDKATNLNKELNPLVTNGTALKTSLENDINQANNLNNNLETNTNRATTINDTLVKNTATAEEKNTTLNNSLNEAKKYIENLDGSQNLPQMRDDITTLQNGLTSNQELAYEGTNLKCENTFDGRIEDIVLEGRTYQNISNITFDNTSQFSDLTNIALFEDNYLVLNFETETTGWTGNAFSKKFNLIKSNTTYTFVVEIITNTLNKPFCLTSPSDDSQFTQYIEIGAGNAGILKYKLKTKKDISQATLGIRSFALIGTSGKIKFRYLLLEGDWTNKEIPSYFEGIKSAGEEENKISILSHGKNLLNEALLLKTGTTLENGKLHYKNIGGISQESNSITMNLDKGTYYLSCFDVKGDFDNLLIGYRIDNDEQFVKPVRELYKSITLTSKTLVKFRITSEGTSSKVDAFFNLQLEKASKTAYEAYQEDKKEILLKDGLKGLPNGVCDTIENREDGTYLVQRVKKIVFDGSGDENFNICANTSEIFIVQIDINGKTDSLTYMSNYNIKNEFRWDIKSWESKDYIGVNFSNTPGKLTLLFPREKYPSLTDMSSFKTWLKNNPITVYYELAEPIETKISDTRISLDTYNALTYVFSNNSISPNIKLKVASNLGSIIQQNAKSINDIYKLIDEVLIPQITTNTANIELLKLK